MLLLLLVMVLKPLFVNDGDAAISDLFSWLEATQGAVFFATTKPVVHPSFWLPLLGHRLNKIWLSRVAPTNRLKIISNSSVPRWPT